MGIHQAVDVLDYTLRSAATHRFKSEIAERSFYERPRPMMHALIVFLAASFAAAQPRD